MHFHLNDKATLSIILLPMVHVLPHHIEYTFYRIGDFHIPAPDICFQIDETLSLAKEMQMVVRQGPVEEVNSLAIFCDRDFSQTKGWASRAVLKWFDTPRNLDPTCSGCATTVPGNSSRFCTYAKVRE